MPAITPESIRALRLRLGLTQEAFAARIGTTQATVNRWEHGTRRPNGPASLALMALLTAHPPVTGE